MLAVAGAQLFTLEIGDGPAVAVMLHGGPGASHDYLRPQLDALADPGRRRLSTTTSAAAGVALDAGVPPGAWHRARRRPRSGADAPRRRALTSSATRGAALLAMLYASSTGARRPLVLILRRRRRA